MRRRQAQRASLPEMRQRLARLRRISSYLGVHASLGCRVRLSLREAGSPTWSPSEDHSWCGWIERNGDEYARELAAAIEAELVARERDLEGDGREEAGGGPPVRP